MPSISQFTLQSLSVTRSPLEMSQMSHWHLKYYHWLDIYNWCTVYTDPQNMMKDSLRRRVGSFPSCHVWVHWRLRVSNVFHYAAQQQDILTLRINFAESRDTRREVMQPPRRRGEGSRREPVDRDRYIDISWLLDFCLYSFVLDKGLGSS